MHRLLAETSQVESEEPALSEEALRHLRVIRPKDGEEVELFDGRGLVRVFRYSASVRALRAAGPSSVAPRSASRDITLFACVTKGSRWDWTIEKATELGARRIVPVVSDRTIVRIPEGEREAKRRRWRKIAEEAARQSDAAWLPEIAAPVDFRDSLALVGRTRCFVGALQDPPPRPLLDAALEAADEDGAEWAAYVGPEGDFTPEELAALVRVAVPVSFGPRILRAETAAIYALSVLSSVASARPRPDSCKGVGAD